MRIISKKDFKDRKARFTCTCCGSVIEAKRSEGRLVLDFRDGDFIVVRCPVCHTDNSVSDTLFKTK